MVVQLESLKIDTTSDIAVKDEISFTLPKIKCSSAPPSPARNSILNSLKLFSKDLETSQLKHHFSGQEEDTQSFTSSTDVQGMRRRSVSDVTVQVSRFPSTLPGSPAYKAMQRANEKVRTSVLEKRFQFGRKKIGIRTIYNKRSSFNKNKPAGNEIHDQHEQYALTYGMMSGIVNSVGLLDQFKQHLTMNDFMRVDKRNFSAGGKLEHPFKFKVGQSSSERTHSSRYYRIIHLIFFGKYEDSSTLIVYVKCSFCFNVLTSNNILVG